MSLSETSEADFLENVLPRFEAEGFQVFMHPSPSLLPAFMESYRPDAVALKQDKKIAFEVVRPTGSADKKIERLQSLFAPHSDWELRILYVSPRTAENTIEVASRAAIADAIQRVIDLTRGGQRLPALVMAWATLEGIGRALLPDQFRRPQTPARLVEVLASEGYLTPREADTLRSAIALRNSAVHGNLDPVVDEKLLEQFVATLRTLSETLPKDN